MSFADGFTGHDFLTWERESQNGLIVNSIMMTGLVAAQIEPEMAECIDDWYSSDDAIQRQRQGYIIDIIRKYPSYHPQGTILVVLQKQCGSFKDFGN